MADTCLICPRIATLTLIAPPVVLGGGGELFAVQLRYCARHGERVAARLRATGRTVLLVTMPSCRAA